MSYRIEVYTIRKEMLFWRAIKSLIFVTALFLFATQIRRNNNTMSVVQFALPLIVRYYISNFTQ